MPQYCQSWCADGRLMSETLPPAPVASSLVQNVDACRLVQRQMTPSSPAQQQQPATSVRQTAYSASTSLSALPMPDLVRESFVDVLPSSISPAAQAQLHPALLVILNSTSHSSSPSSSSSSFSL